MRSLCLGSAVAVLTLTSIGLAQHSASSEPYKILKTVKVGGDGGFDYVNSDVANRRLYVARSGPTGRVGVFSLDTFEKVGEIPNVNSHGAAIDPKSGHGFLSSKTITMFDMWDPLESTCRHASLSIL